MIATRRRRGMLHRVHQGVHLFGTDVMLPGGSELAAVLACGEHVWVRRRSALGLLAVIPRWPGDVEVTVRREHAVKRSGIAVHRVAELPAIGHGTQDGIPIIAPALALMEFATVATDDQLERAISEAYALKLVSEPELRAVIGRHPFQAGVAALRAELDRAGGPMWTASKAERLMKELLRKAGLPMPQTRERVAGHMADFLWRQFQLIVEVDGYQYHGHRYAFERDRRRDQAHISVGYRVIRFTWRQLNDDPLHVIAVIARAIGTARPAG
jgi:very-short-patch-repair endonuclease